jgi:hypothetical protein
MDEFVPPIEDLQYGSRRLNDGVIWLREDKVEGGAAQRRSLLPSATTEVPRSRRQVGLLGRP